MLEAERRRLSFFRGAKVAQDTRSTREMFYFGSTILEHPSFRLCDCPFQPDACWPVPLVHGELREMVVR